MQNYRYRSSGISRGCMRQLDSRQDNARSDAPCEASYQNSCSTPCQDSCKTSRREVSDRECCTGIALDCMPVAMAYVPWTRWKNIYEAEKGFRRGTIFQDLDKPFHGTGGCQNGR